ncbi:hypothetical protein BD408DRAFT_416034 [Parasitella parasitica]|nr:hypothetical protein BD408DRAFT_416034 [Parasitella parasitica]
MSCFSFFSRFFCVHHWFCDFILFVLLYVCRGFLNCTVHTHISLNSLPQLLKSNTNILCTNILSRQFELRRTNNCFTNKTVVST